MKFNKYLLFGFLFLTQALSAQTFNVNNLAASNINVGSSSFTGIGTATFAGSGLNDATFGGSYVGNGTKAAVVKINTTGTPDALAVSNDGGATFQTTTLVYNPVTDSYVVTPIYITSGPMLLFNGATATFGATTGHTVGAQWALTLTANPAVLNTYGNGFSVKGQPFAGSFGTQNTQLGIQSFGGFSNIGVQNTGLGAFTLFNNTSGYANNGIGALALQYNTTGFFNDALGVQSLQLNTTGYDNTALGQFTMMYNITGYSNTAVGSDALGYNIAGLENTGVGVQALYSNVNGQLDTAVGLWSQRGGTSSLRPTSEVVTATLTNASPTITLGTFNPNIQVGEGIFGTGIPANTTVSVISGTTITMSANATAPGAQTLTFAVVVNGTTTIGSTAVTLASSNALIAIGQSVTGTGIVTQSSTPTPFTYVTAVSGTSVTLSQAATASGTNPLTFGYSDAQLSPNYDTSIGTRSLFLNYNGSYNYAGGLESLYNTRSNANVGVGAESGFQNVIGSNNVWIGYNSGANVSQPYNASGVTAVGEGTWGVTNSVTMGILASSPGANAITVGQSSSGFTNDIVIGAGSTASGTGTTIIANGLTTATNNVTLIGGTTNTGNFFYGGLQPQTDNAFAIGGAGARWASVWATTGVVNTSDAREKNHIKPIDARVLKAWKKVHFVQFQWNADTATHGNEAKTQFGVIAQDIMTVFKSEGLNALDYGLVTLDSVAANDSRYGVRYDQVMVIEAAYERQLLERLQKRAR